MLLISPLLASIFVGDRQSLYSSLIFLARFCLQLAGARFKIKRHYESSLDPIPQYDT